MELNGRKTLYSACYFTEEQLFEWYNGDHYKLIKEKYDPDQRLRGWHCRLTRP